MRFGISTSCFYPEETDRALARLLDADVSLVEVFFNTFSELEDGYIAHMGSLLAAHGAAVSQMHPFTSAMEGFFFATDYVKNNYGVSPKSLARTIADYDVRRFFNNDNKQQTD